jgi:hypothetical protein
LHTHEARVVLVGHSLDEACRRRPIDELDRAVRLQEQVLCDLADRRRAHAVVSAHREQELVLRTGDARRDRLRLAPREEPAQTRSEGEEIPVLLIRDRRVTVRHGLAPLDALESIS